MARRRNEAVSAAIQRVEADAASRDAARIDVRGSVRQNLAKGVDTDAHAKLGPPTHGSSSATAYPALDTFGRTRRILWKDGTFAPGTITGEPNRPPLVELAYAFDQASNLVAKADARHAPPQARRAARLWRIDCTAGNRPNRRLQVAACKGFR